MKLAFGVICKKTLPISMVQSFPPHYVQRFYVFCFVLFFKGFTPLPLLGRVLSFCSTYGETPVVFSAWKKHFFLQRNPFSKNLPLAGPHPQTPVLYFRGCHRFKSLKFSSFHPPNWFFLKVVLTILDFSHFHANFYTRSPISTEHPAESSPKVLESMDCFWVEWTH